MDEISFILAGITVLSGIIASIWLSKVAEEELKELSPYFMVSRQIVFITALIVSAFSFYYSSGSLWMFLILALMVLAIYFFRKQSISEHISYFALGAGFAVASFHELFFSAALLSCMFMILSTSLIYSENPSRRKIGRKIFFTLKAMLINAALFIIPLLVRVWYSG